MEGVNHRKRSVRHLNDGDDVVDQKPSGQTSKAQKPNPRSISKFSTKEKDGENEDAISHTFHLVGSDLPSESSGLDFVGSTPPPPKSNRSSLQSVDIRFANRLVGPGTTSSRLTTNDQLRVGTMNISSILMSARKENVARQSELESISDLLYVSSLLFVIHCSEVFMITDDFYGSTLEHSTSYLAKPFSQLI